MVTRDSSTNPAVVVLARYWAEGPVKTRLAATIGAAAARVVYRELAERVWCGLDGPDLDRHLWVTPAGAVDRTASWLSRSFRTAAQPAADLGVRIATALGAAFTLGAPWAAVVGTDAPAVDAAMVCAAGRLLDDADVAIVPSIDGGYALLALSRPIPELFDGVPWSTPRVLEVTQARARELGLRIALLPPVRDLDDEDDLRALQADGLV